MKTLGYLIKFQRGHELFQTVDQVAAQWEVYRKSGVTIFGELPNPFLVETPVICPKCGKVHDEAKI